jgi:hypothetical protein
MAALLVTIGVCIADLISSNFRGAIGSSSHTVAALAPTVTVTAAPAPTPDDRFIAELASHGISGGSLEAPSQYFMELAHYVCFRLLPPDPQPRGPEIDRVMTAENKNVDDGAHMLRFSHSDAEHLVDAAI